MRNLLLLSLAFAFALSTKSQTTITGSLTATDPTYNRVIAGNPPTLLSAVGTAVFYKVVTVTIAVPGSVTFICSSNFDSFGTLYSPAGFDPLNAITNTLIANDDSISSDFGFSYNFTSPGIYYLVVSSFDNAVTGDFTITSTAGAVLPLSVLSFSATKVNASLNEIKWHTAGEINIDFFKVQKSTDGRNYSDMPNASIPAQNTIAGSSYSLRDATPFAGYNFYRLSIVERSGRISYSSVAVINNNETQFVDWRIFPNPATDFIQVEKTGQQNEPLSIHISNAAGQTLLAKEYKENQPQIISLDVRNLTKGIYFLRIKTANGISTKQFMKQ